jgi:putative ABC transport system permease protein
MKFNDIFSMSLNSLTHRKLRSWLTVLGIVVGVASVVALVSIGQGLQQSITSQLGGLGANLITISLGYQRAGGGFGFGGERATISSSNLTDSDIRTIRATPGIQYVDGIVSGNAKVSFASQTTSLSIQGVDTSVWKYMITTKLESGRYLSTGDTYVVVVGYNVAHGLFKKDMQLNSIISIEGHSFRVVGILQQAGGFGGGGERTIYISKNDARQVLDTGLSSIQYSSISAQVSQSSDMQTVVNQLTTNLMLIRHVTNSTRDFTVSSSLSAQQSISSISNTITYFLGGIASISLLVGGIGIANTMFMSVVERTRQIGVLKSLGTTNNEIMKIFLTEAGLIGLIGGIIGAIFGIIMSGLISLIGGGNFLSFGPRNSTQGFQTVVTPQVIILVIGFSLFIGAISGLFPARRAAKLEPVEALRYE